MNVLFKPMLWVKGLTKQEQRSGESIPLPHKYGLGPNQFVWCWFCPWSERFFSALLKAKNSNSDSVWNTLEHELNWELLSVIGYGNLIQLFYIYKTLNLSPGNRLETDAKHSIDAPKDHDKDVMWKIRRENWTMNWKRIATFKKKNTKMLKLKQMYITLILYIFH